MWALRSQIGNSKEPLVSAIQVLKENRSLKIVDLRKNGITEEGAVMIAEAGEGIKSRGLNFVGGNT